MGSQRGNRVAHLQDAIGILKQIDLALDMHLDWMKRLHKMLICNLEPNLDEISPDAHRHCSFGQWYYHLDDLLRSELESSSAMGAPHKAMHQAARKLLLAREHRGAINSANYEHFMELASAFNLSLISCQNELIQSICSIDHLTGAWNRQSLSFRLREETERARRTGHPLCLCMLDLDHFKQINDNYGHNIGDEVLKQLSRFLKNQIRPYDSLFRYGGEEFILCLPNTQLAEAGKMLNRVCRKLSEHAIDTPALEIQITASFGVALNHEGEHVDRTIERADHALLCAKAKGRNQVCIWNMDEHGQNFPLYRA